nr:FlhC family transcriptional regulator [Burkholderia sp. 4M9327F10]
MRFWIDSSLWTSSVVSHFVEMAIRNPAEALIATNDIYSRLFGGAPLIGPDRGYNLTRSMVADTRLALAPCRSCGTHYVVSNSDAKIEMRNSFVCPACNHQLGPRRRAARKGGEK